MRCSLGDTNLHMPDSIVRARRLARVRDDDDSALWASPGTAPWGLEGRVSPRVAGDACDVRLALRSPLPCCASITSPSSLAPSLCGIVLAIVPVETMGMIHTIVPASRAAPPYFGGCPSNALSPHPPVDALLLCVLVPRGHYLKGCSSGLLFLS